MAFLANPSGRLIHFERSSGKLSVLLDNLWFANGVALSPAEDFIVVSDLGRSKLVKVSLKSGESETFIEGLPGVPDNLSSDKNGLWVALPLTADADHPYLGHSMAPLPLLRKFHARLASLVELLFTTIDGVFPNDFCKNIADKVGSGESVMFLYPNRATILRLDWNGNIIAAYHSFDGAVYTHVMEMDGHLYLGSISHNYIAKVVKRAHL
jgi:adipocyte plasma membrane-associated protein